MAEDDADKVDKRLSDDEIFLIGSLVLKDAQWRKAQSRRTEAAENVDRFCASKLPVVFRPAGTQKLFIVELDGPHGGPGIKVRPVDSGLLVENVDYPPKP